MNRKHAISLAGGTAAVAGLLLAASFTANGLEYVAPVPVAAPAEARILVAQATPAPVLVSYTAEQAKRGEDRYKRDCVECHGDDLGGGLLGGPPLKGAGFEEKFAQGAPASALFGFMSTAMPPNSPGRYSPTVYADIMAFILKKNGFQPGAELPSDIDALDTLTVEK